MSGYVTIMISQTHISRPSSWPYMPYIGCMHTRQTRHFTAGNLSIMQEQSHFDTQQLCCKTQQLYTQETEDDPIKISEKGFTASISAESLY